MHLAYASCIAWRSTTYASVQAMQSRAEQSRALRTEQLVTLREEALDLRFRDTPKNRSVSVVGERPVLALRARLEAAT